MNIINNTEKYIKLKVIKGRRPIYLLLGMMIFISSFSLFEKDWKLHASTTREVLKFTQPKCHYCGQIEKDQTLSTAFEVAGISHSYVYDIQQALKGIYDLRHLIPGDKFEITYSPHNGEMQFNLKKSPWSGYQVIKTADTLYGLRDSLDLEYSIKAARGTVESTLWEAMRNSGMSPKLIMEFTDLLRYDFDFVTDTRPGQKFRVLYEVYSFNGEYAYLGKILFGEYEELSGTIHSACHYKAPNDKEGYFNLKGKSVKRSLLKTPLSYRRVSSHFTHARFHPILKKYRPHLGVDFAAPTGTPVVASGSGRVSYAGWKGGYGNFIEIKHAQGIVTMYGHLSKFGSGVKKGVRVKEGQVIGYVGSTGLSTGPHLDYRVKVNGKFVNPLKYAFPTGPPVEKRYMDQYLAYSAKAEQLTRNLSVVESKTLVLSDREEEKKDEKISKE